MKNVLKMETTTRETPKTFDFSKSSSMKSSITESNVLLDMLLIDFFIFFFLARLGDNSSPQSRTNGMSAGLSSCGSSIETFSEADGSHW